MTLRLVGLGTAKPCCEKGANDTEARESRRGTWALVTTRGIPGLSPGRESTERPRAPSGVAAFMSAQSKTPYITPDFPSVNGVVRGCRGQQL